MSTRTLRLVTTAPSPASDTLALARVAAGEVSALGVLYDRHAVALLRFAARIVGVDDAQDLVHASFLRAVKVAGSYDGRDASARSWLLGITARLAQERRRSLARCARALLRLGEFSSRSPDTGHRADLARGLRALSEAKRVVIILAEVEGFTCEEIAEMLEVPVGTVWTRLHHARKELRAFYAEGPS